MYFFKELYCSFLTTHQSAQKGYLVPKELYYCSILCCK